MKSTVRTAVSAAALSIVLAVPGSATSASASTPGVDGDSGAWSTETLNDPATADAIKEFRAYGNLARSGKVKTAACPVSVSPKGVTSSADCVDTVLVYRKLSVSWQQQVAYSMCGPASVSMASHYYGTDKGQWTIRERLGITTKGSDREQIANGMEWVSRGKPFIQIPAPDTSTIWGALHYSIGEDADPIATNTHELEGAGHSNQHLSRDIGHFILAVGYSGGGSTGIYNDPASGLAGGYSESAKQFSLATSTMSWYVDDRGIVVVDA